MKETKEKKKQNLLRKKAILEYKKHVEAGNEIKRLKKQFQRIKIIRYIGILLFLFSSFTDIFYKL